MRHLKCIDKIDIYLFCIISKRIEIIYTLDIELYTLDTYISNNTI